MYEGEAFVECRRVRSARVDKESVVCDADGYDEIGGSVIDRLSTFCPQCLKCITYKGEYDLGSA